MIRPIGFTRKSKMYPGRVLNNPRFKMSWNCGINAGGRNSAITYSVRMMLLPLK